MSQIVTVPAGPPLGQKGFIEGAHALRAIAALAVVFFHAGGSIASSQYQGLESFGALTFGLDAGVDLFFVLSGFVISLPLFRGKQYGVSEYIFGRLLRIYPISALTALIFLFLNWLIFSRASDLSTVLSSVLLVPNGTTPVPVVLWTLKQELLFYALFLLCYLNRAAGFATIFVWSVASFIIDMPSAIGSWLFNHHNVQFIFGIAAAYVFLSARVPRKAAIIGLPVFLTAFFVCAFAFKGSNIPKEVAALVLGALGSVSILTASAALRSISGFVQYLGTASYSLYLIHFLVISFMQKVIQTVMPDLPGLMALAMLVGASVGAGCVYYAVFEQRIEIWRKRYLRKNIPPQQVAIR